MQNKKKIEAVLQGKERIDIYLKIAAGVSRGAVQKYIDAGNVSINGKTAENYHVKIKNGDIIEYIQEIPREEKLEPADIPVDVIYEDEYMLAINKQPGLVVHPSFGHAGKTLVNALLGRHINEKDFAGHDNRLGIVHRLDKDTSGVMIVAKNNDSHLKLSGLFRNREIKKIYTALVHGEVGQQGFVNTTIARDLRDRKKYTAKLMSGKDAQTIFSPAESFYQATLLKVQILTGRTHQIRVHMSHLKHEIAGDQIYGSRQKDTEMVKYLGYDVKSILDLLPRQMLHAVTLSFTHPFTAKRMEFTAPLAPDFEKIVTMLRKKS